MAGWDLEAVQVAGDDDEGQCGWQIDGWQLRCLHGCTSRFARKGRSPRAGALRNSKAADQLGCQSRDHASAPHAARPSVQQLAHRCSQHRPASDRCCCPSERAPIRHRPPRLPLQPIRTAAGAGRAGCPPTVASSFPFSSSHRGDDPGRQTCSAARARPPNRASQGHAAMSHSQRSYVAAIRGALSRALCLQTFPSQVRPAGRPSAPGLTLALAPSPSPSPPACSPRSRGCHHRPRR